ncbi:MAG: RNA polymerase sigma factor [bacterium]|nr:RNA polymerase sigma factor [bacterium]
MSSERDQLSQWMSAYQAGELDAFERLHGQLAPRLRRYLLSLTMSQPRADDLLQETFLQIHRSRHTYTPPRPVEPWAFGVARHVYLMDCRAWARRRRLEADQGEELPELPVPAFGEGFPDRNRLRRAVATLSDDQREPLLLHHVWGFSFREIAGMLGIQEVAAKVRAHRARKQLQGVLETDLASNPVDESSQGEN